MSEEDISMLNPENGLINNNQAIEVLLNELSSFKSQVADLTLTVKSLQIENYELKQLLYNETQNAEVPRKIAKSTNIIESGVIRNITSSNINDHNPSISNGNGAVKNNNNNGIIKNFSSSNVNSTNNNTKKIINNSISSNAKCSNDGYKNKKKQFKLLALTFKKFEVI